MGRKPVYRNEQTSIKISQLASVLVGLKKRFDESKGDFIERIIIEMCEPALVKQIRDDLHKKSSAINQKKLDVLHQERRLRQKSLNFRIDHPVSVDNNDVYDPNKTFTNNEICKLICDMHDLPKTPVFILSADVKILPKYLKSGEIIQLSKDEYRIAPITKN